MTWIKDPEPTLYWHKKAKDDQRQKAREMQRSAQWRVEFVSSENSMGFHAPQEAGRILGEAIDMARKGRLAISSGQ